MANLKSAPLFLASGKAARAALGLEVGSRTSLVPIETTKLVDRPRRSADPALARANDIETHDSAARNGGTMVDADQYTPAGAVQPSVRPVELAPLDWPDAPLPVEDSAAADRLALIRQAAKRISDRSSAKASPRISAGLKCNAAPAIPQAPSAVRRARITAAIAFLKAQGTLAMPVDRDALIRRYWVTGRRISVYAEELIEMAEARGMPAAGDAR